MIKIISRVSEFCYRVESLLQPFQSVGTLTAIPCGHTIKTVQKLATGCQHTETRTGPSSHLRRPAVHLSLFVSPSVTLQDLQLHQCLYMDMGSLSPAASPWHLPSHHHHGEKEFCSVYLLQRAQLERRLQVEAGLKLMPRCLS